MTPNYIRHLRFGGSVRLAQIEKVAANNRLSTSSTKGSIARKPLAEIVPQRTICRDISADDGAVSSNPRNTTGNDAQHIQATAGSPRIETKLVERKSPQIRRHLAKDDVQVNVRHGRPG